MTVFRFRDDSDPASGNGSAGDLILETHRVFLIGETVPYHPGQRLRFRSQILGPSA